MRKFKIIVNGTTYIFKWSPLYEPLFFARKYISDVTHDDAEINDQINDQIKSPRDWFVHMFATDHQIRLNVVTDAYDHVCRFLGFSESLNNINDVIVILLESGPNTINAVAHLLYDLVVIKEGNNDIIDLCIDQMAGKDVMMMNRKHPCANEPIPMTHYSTDERHVYRFIFYNIIDNTDRWASGTGGWASDTDDTSGTDSTDSNYSTYRAYRGAYGIEGSITNHIFDMCFALDYVWPDSDDDDMPRWYNNVKDEVIEYIINLYKAYRVIFDEFLVDLPFDADHDIDFSILPPVLIEYDDDDRCELEDINTLYDTSKTRMDMCSITQGLDYKRRKKIRQVLEHIKKGVNTKSRDDDDLWIDAAMNDSRFDKLIMYGFWYAAHDLLDSSS